ncbi:MAG TPA: hypothetical protein VHX38_19720 [Pseudonocardiaceae bacterium]|nr:hypothetical protein [Pseudonocardiaceae bacterium]
MAATVSFTAGLGIAIAGAAQIIGGDQRDRIWLVLVAVVGLIALGLLRAARDDRRVTALGVGWAVLGLGIGGFAVWRMPAAGPGSPLGTGWALLVVGGAAALLGGALLAVRPWSRPRGRRGFAPLVVLGVCAVLVAGCWGAVAWTGGQNVRLTVADSAPLAPRTAVLDGRRLWTSVTDGDVVGSDGGLLITEQDGVQMVDPSTGRTRWSYSRTDIASVLDPVASADGKLVAVELMMPSSLTDGITRLVVFDAVTGTVLADPLTMAVHGGSLAAVTDSAVYVADGENGIDTTELRAVDTTGPQAGKIRWTYLPAQNCQLTGFSAAGQELAVSTDCGTVAMLGQDGKPRWTYRAPTKDVEVWPLTGAPAGTVVAATQAATGVPGDTFGTPPGITFGHPPNVGVSAPQQVIELDAGTGTVRRQQSGLPQAPFAPDSDDAGQGSMSPIWAGSTAVLTYYLPTVQEVWLVGIDPTTGATWSTTVHGIEFSQFSQGSSYYAAALPDGRILLPSQDPNATNEIVAQPQFVVVSGRTGEQGPTIQVGPIASATGLLGSPATVLTPAGVVLAIAGPGLNESSPPRTLLVGLH